MENPTQQTFVRHSVSLAKLTLSISLTEKILQ